MIQEMKNVYWTERFKEVYQRAVELYGAGNRELESYFDEGELDFLKSIGIRPINVYDAAEDVVKYGDPDWETTLLVVAARRDYFLHEQKGEWGALMIDSSELPPKDAELEGIVWLPRIIRKAQCFLNGGLCHDIMYGCGGDRKFFADNQVHPADFLRACWASKGDTHKLVEFVRGPGF